VVFNGAFAFRMTKQTFRQPLACDQALPQRAMLSGGSPGSFVSGHGVKSWVPRFQSFSRLIFSNPLENRNTSWNACLAVEPQQVVPGQTEATDGRVGLQATMWPMPIVVMQPVGQFGSPLVRVLIGTGVGHRQ
jgi:hypothetical protein